MKVVIQRVTEASVEIGGREHASIGRGFVVLLGIEASDDEQDLEYLATKTSALRIFGDEEGKMNLDLLSVGGELLVISQFTLHASTRKGNRPSFIMAAPPEKAIPLYEKFVAACDRLTGKASKTGVFGADMKVSLVNDGPVTIIIDSKVRE
jgi:D-aminoacyl-tRNA deacylase